VRDPVLVRAAGAGRRGRARGGRGAGRRAGGGRGEGAAAAARLLPPHLAVYFTLALCLLARLPYQDALRSLAGDGATGLVVLPRRLTTDPLRPGAAGTALKEALDSWRTADFASRQRDALTAGSSDVLRDAIVKDSEKDYDRRLKRLITAQGSLASTQANHQQIARTARQAAFSYEGTMPDLRAARAGLATGAILGIVPVVITLLTTHPLSGGGSGYPILDFLNGTAWTLLDWAGLGWFIGYYLPLARGGNGTEKALWIFVAIAAASLPASLVWNDAHAWSSVMVTDLQLLVFLVIATVIVGDLRALKNSGFPLADWPRAHNWRFVATWSTALLTAVATIALTFATTTVTDISQQLTPPPAATGGASAQQSP
jgi:hypothetical protein